MNGGEILREVGWIFSKDMASFRSMGYKSFAEIS